MSAAATTNQDRGVVGFLMMLVGPSCPGVCEPSPPGGNGGPGGIGPGGLGEIGPAGPPCCDTGGGGGDGGGPAIARDAASERPAGSAAVSGIAAVSVSGLGWPADSL